jgi:hypothetical protein
MRPGTHQQVTYSEAAGTIANAVGSQTRVVRVVVEAGEADPGTTARGAHVAIGVSPTATASDMYVPHGVPEYFSINPGEKVSAIENVTAGGQLHVTEMW